MTGDTRTFMLPAERGDLIALAYRTGEVIAQDVDGECYAPYGTAEQTGL